MEYRYLDDIMGFMKQLPREIEPVYCDIATNQDTIKMHTLCFAQLVLFFFPQKYQHNIKPIIVTVSGILMAMGR